MSDNTPTEPFSQSAGMPPATPPTTPPGTPGSNEPKSRRPLITLLVIGGIVLVAILVTVGIFVGRGMSGTQASATSSPTLFATPTPTPSAAPVHSATPAPTSGSSTRHTTAPSTPSNAPAIQVFLVNNSTNPVVYCNTQAPNPPEIDLTFKWASTNVSEVYFGVNTNDASEGPYFSNLPPSGDNSDFPQGNQTFAYQCPQEQSEYTLTVVNSHGTKVSRSVTVLNKGDHS
jgi:hypothetical protein